MDTSDLLFVGVKGHVVAFNKLDGTQLWKVKLKRGLRIAGNRFVTVLADGERVYAHTYGELFCLDAQTGEQLWSNELAGLSYDITMLAVVGTSSPPLPARIQQRRKRASDSGDGGGEE